LGFKNQCLVLFFCFIALQIVAICKYLLSKTCVFAYSARLLKTVMLLFDRFSRFFFDRRFVLYLAVEN